MANKWLVGLGTDPLRVLGPYGPEETFALARGVRQLNEVERASEVVVLEAFDLSMARVRAQEIARERAEEGRSA